MQENGHKKHRNKQKKPLFFATLALFLNRLSPFANYFPLIYKVLICVGDSDRCF